jgi:hypothetical protein
MVHTKFHLEPTEVDIHEMREALDGDESFLSYTEEKKPRLFVGLLKIKRIMELYDDVAEVNETTKRIRLARKVQARFRGALEIVKENNRDAHWLETLADIRVTQGLSYQEVIEWAAVLEKKLGAVLRSSKRTWPRKKYRAPSTRPPKALAEVGMMRALLESLGDKVGATGGAEGGPATRLMVRMHAYIRGGQVIKPDTITDRLKRLRKWEAQHPDWRPTIKKDFER